MVIAGMILGQFMFSSVNAQTQKPVEGVFDKLTVGTLNVGHVTCPPTDGASSIAFLDADGLKVMDVSVGSSVLSGVGLTLKKNLARKLPILDIMLMAVGCLNLTILMEI